MKKKKKNKRRTPPFNELFPRKKDSSGNPLCRYCGGKVKPPRSAWCSNDCVDKAMLETNPGVQKDFVFDRDKGKCQLCNLDVKSLEDGYKVSRRAIHTEYNKKLRELERWRDLEIKKIEVRRKVTMSVFGSHHKKYWEMDHTIPLSEGGSNTPDNLRVLCVKCHKQETALLHKRLAAARRKKKGD